AEGVEAAPGRRPQLRAIAPLPPPRRRRRALLRDRPRSRPLRSTARARADLHGPQPAVLDLDAEGLPRRDPARDRGGGVRRRREPLGRLPPGVAAARGAWYPRLWRHHLRLRLERVPARADSHR